VQLCFTNIHHTDTETQQQFFKQVKQTLKNITEAYCCPSSMLKVCKLAIWLHMTSKQDQDFDCLNLPTKLTALVTFEYLAQQ
jgi:hypothetical protein